MVETPKSIEDVTAAWLTEALGTFIVSIDVEPIASGEGFMGQLARIHVTADDSSVPKSVIVKLPTLDPGARTLGEVTRAWEREHRFYELVAPLMTIRVPIAHVNVGIPPCLVLEDLSPAIPGDHVAGATLEQAERAIDVLATHHAEWFEDARLAEWDWMPGLDDPAIFAIGDTFAVGWPIFLERFSDSLPSRCLRWCERFAEGVPGWIAGHNDDPVTMTHGDFRLDNLFFVDDGSVAVIDWQLSMRAPGQADFVYFCANNLTADMRRAHERDLLHRYVDGLHGRGVPSDEITTESVWQGYLEGLVFYAVSFGASLLTIDPANERGVELFEVLVHRTFTAVDDLDAGLALGFPAAG